MCIPFGRFSTFKPHFRRHVTQDVMRRKDRQFGNHEAVVFRLHRNCRASRRERACGRLHRSSFSGRGPGFVASRFTAMFRQCCSAVATSAKRLRSANCTARRLNFCAQRFAGSPSHSDPVSLPLRRDKIAQRTRIDRAQPRSYPVVGQALAVRDTSYRK